jgi:hypothetical protein
MKTKPKEMSVFAIIAASIWIIAGITAKAVFPAAFGSALDISVPEIISSGVILVVLWTPIYRSVWLDKKIGLDRNTGDLPQKEGAGG